MTKGEEKLAFNKAFIALKKCADTCCRAHDPFDAWQWSESDIAYALEQIGKMLAYASEARQELERVEVARGVANASELARKRLADPAYTPSINEVADGPDAFLDGFREG